MSEASDVTTIGTRIDETGTLIRDGGAFYLRRDLGGRYQLELQRTPVDLVEKRVRLVGTVVAAAVVAADGVGPAGAACWTDQTAVRDDPHPTDRRPEP